MIFGKYPFKHYNKYKLLLHKIAHIKKIKFDDVS